MHTTTVAEDEEGTCSFQFWVDRIESFYCKLDSCSWQAKADFSESWRRNSHWFLVRAMAWSLTFACMFDQTRTGRAIVVRRWNVLVFLVVSFAERTAASVSGRHLLRLKERPTEDAYLTSIWSRHSRCLTDIDDFLAEEVKGPASFNCETGKGCAFEEPAMNQLINDIFGDNSITLDCNSGECMHYTNVPGYQVGLYRSVGDCCLNRKVV